MIDQINAQKRSWNIIGFADDGKSKGQSVDRREVLGGADFLRTLKSSMHVVMAVAEPSTRKKLYEGIQSQGFKFPSLIHPNARVGNHSNSFADGSIITDGCIFTVGITVHPFVIVNLNCTIGHDVSIGAFASVMPGSNISGNVNIGERALIGTGVKILQGISIGAGARVGAGAVVTRDVAPSLTVIGIPAKPRKQ